MLLKQLVTIMRQCFTLVLCFSFMDGKPSSNKQITEKSKTEASSDVVPSFEKPHPPNLFAGDIPPPPLIPQTETGHEEEQSKHSSELPGTLPSWNRSKRSVSCLFGCMHGGILKMPLGLFDGCRCICPKYARGLRCEFVVRSRRRRLRGRRRRPGKESKGSRGSKHRHRHSQRSRRPRL